MIDCIKEILIDKHWDPTTKNLELKDQSSNMKVSVTQLPENGLVFHVPPQKAHVAILEDTPSLKQSCDKLILIPQNGNIDAYFIEMKESLSPDCNNGISIKKAAEQILHTVPVLDYLTSMVKIHFQKEQKINMCFLVIADKLSPKFDKQGVKPNKVESHEYNGEKFKTLHSLSTIPFSKIKCQ